MGCDIHAHYEFKSNGKWLYAKPLDVSRDYELFYIMAGVRAYSETIRPISMPKGLPDDITDSAKWQADYWGTDGHSHSWFNSEEIKELKKWCDENDRKNYFSYFKNGPFCYSSIDPTEKRSIEDLRLIFWFDN